MVGNLAAGILTLALVSLGGTVSNVAGGAAQFAQNETEQDARRAAEEAEYGAERARDDDRQDILDAQENARRGALLKKEEGERESSTVEAERHRTERKARLKALIEK
jgi:hypothetical protein